jgi:hypothetical protein
MLALWQEATHLPTHLDAEVVNQRVLVHMQQPALAPCPHSDPGGGVDARDVVVVAVYRASKVGTKKPGREG